MAEISIYFRVRDVTEREFGIARNPHSFRDSIPTSLAIDDPKHVGAASTILGHADPRVTERHYNLAKSIEAVRDHQKTIRGLRGSLCEDQASKRCGLIRSTTMRAAIYARYSSDIQREASIEDQVRLCRARIEREGLAPVATLHRSCGEWGHTVRPGYQNLLLETRARRVRHHRRRGARPIVPRPRGRRRAY